MQPASTGGFWNNWSGFVENKISPALGEPISDAFADDYVDQSEYEAALAIQRPLDFAGGLLMEVRGGFTAQPHLSDDNAQESSYYGQLTLGDTYLPLGRAVQDGRLQKADDIEDAVRLFGRYRFASVHSGFLEKRTRDEQQTTAGIRYRDVRRIRCTDGRTAKSEYPCGNVAGWSWEARAELTYLWSTESSKDRIFPTVRGDIISGPFWGGFRGVVSAVGEWSFYQNERVGPESDLRQDFRLRVQAGVDITGPLRRLFGGSKAVSGEVLGRFQRNWSDRSDKEHSRIYFVPSLSFRTTF